MPCENHDNRIPFCSHGSKHTINSFGWSWYWRTECDATMDSPIPSVLPTKSAGIKRANDVPFDQLPNLPKPIVPEIALNIQRMGLAAMLQVK